MTHHHRTFHFKSPAETTNDERATADDDGGSAGFFFFYPYFTDTNTGIAKLRKVTHMRQASDGGEFGKLISKQKK